jgi:hypothetical protein
MKCLVNRSSVADGVTAAACVCRLSAKAALVSGERGFQPTSGSGFPV